MAVKNRTASTTYCVRGCRCVKLDEAEGMSNPDSYANASECALPTCFHAWALLVVSITR
jgi:hypothetical protein